LSLRIADAILDVSRHRDILLDPFVGSGTTILAAERTGRRGYGHISQDKTKPHFLSTSWKPRKDEKGKQVNCRVDVGSSGPQLGQLLFGIGYVLSQPEATGSQGGNNVCFGHALKVVAGMAVARLYWVAFAP
jgi:hypothetical protein